MVKYFIVYIAVGFIKSIFSAFVVVIDAKPKKEVAVEEEPEVVDEVVDSVKNTTKVDGKNREFKFRNRR